MTHEITLLRHGESTGNIERRIQGHIDFPLSDDGRDQAEGLARRWHKEGVEFDLIITSTLQRAQDTAQIIAQTLGVPIEENPIWVERYFGSLEGELLDEAVANDPNLDFFQPYTRLGGEGESQIDLYARAIKAVQELIHKPPGNYLVVSHGAIMNKVLYAILGITPQGNYNSPIFPFGNIAYFKLGYHADTRQWFLYEFINPLLQHRKVR
jgi:2,3-bisphosphoglycerate-dependent phosphoglycerate mutase